MFRPEGNPAAGSPSWAGTAQQDAAQRLLPRCHFEERHSLDGIEGMPHDIIDAICRIDDTQDAVLSSLLWLRELPGRWLERIRPGTGIPNTRKRFGLQNFAVLERSSCEVAFGLAGQFWKLDFGLVPVLNVASFRQLAGPKLVLSFRVISQGGSHCQLETVTRVLCSDVSSLRRMKVYWGVIRPFSGWIRRRILRQVKRTVEQALRASGKV